MSLEFDIRRSIILSSYIKHWGEPEFRQIMSKDDKAVELYTFRGDLIQRYATVGLSSCVLSNGAQCDTELLLAVPSHIVEEQSEAIVNYIFDISSYLLETLGKNAEAEVVVPESPLAPSGWPKALLFDQPCGEPEELACFHVGAQHVNLLWVVPIFGTEYDLIKTKGIESFDEAIQTIDLSVVDVRRPSCV